MRFVSYTAGDACGFGMLTADGQGVIELGSAARQRISGITDLGQLVGQMRLEDARHFAEEPADHAIEDITYERLLPWPGKIFCIGVNYGGRSAEYADKPGRRIPVSEARGHIAGLTLGNEGTIRDWVRHAKFNVTQGKNWDSTGSFGPHLTTIDEIDRFEDLRITTHVNGELRQDDSPATMKYSIEYQIHYLSTFTLLRPGDIIFSGTPTGAGARFDPPKWLVPGDVVEVSVPELGTLRNTVADATEVPGFDGVTVSADAAVPEPQ